PITNDELWRRNVGWNMENARTAPVLRSADVESARRLIGDIRVGLDHRDPRRRAGSNILVQGDQLAAIEGAGYDVFPVVIRRATTADDHGDRRPRGCDSEPRRHPRHRPPHPSSGLLSAKTLSTTENLPRASG